MFWKTLVSSGPHPPSPGTCAKHKKPASGLWSARMACTSSKWNCVASDLPHRWAELHQLRLRGGYMPVME